MEARWSLPVHWKWLAISDIGQIVGGGTPPASDETNFDKNGIPWITPADLTGYSGTYIERGARDLSEKGYKNSGARLMPPGSVLFSSRAPIGYCVIAKNEISTNQGFKSLVPKPEHNAEFLRYYLLSAKEYAESLASGTTFKELSGARMATLAVPVPPLSEQRHIVKKLDSLTGRTARAREQLGRIPKLIQKYREAILAAAFSGNVTKDWRELKGLPEWRRTTIADIGATIFDGPFGSNLKSVDYVDSGVRVIRLENIGHLSFRAEKKTFISLEKYESLRRHALQADDVLFSSFVSEDVRVCLFPAGQDVPAINKADCFCVRVDRSRCDPRFLAFRLACRSTFEDMKELVHGATRPRISLTQLKSYGFEIPSLLEQYEIVRRIETAFVWLDRITAEHANASRLLPKLNQAILGKAFRGELVPQDPSESLADLSTTSATEARAAVLA
jgi:type I restriction enzyme S subunit